MGKYLLDGGGAAQSADDLLVRGEARSGPDVALNVSVVVPTRNEAANVAPLLDRLQTVLAGSNSEVIFVDDSDDETPDVVRREAKLREADLRVSLVHREPGDRAGGLGSAVTAGMVAAGGDWVVVMDGDLQHPPELIPDLIARAAQDDAQIVVASRHVEGGASDGLDGWLRVKVSTTATALVKMSFPRALRGVSDPMSGFFAVRLDAIDVDALRPEGFKILMEILVRTPSLRRSEVGFVFDERQSGESKASGAEGLRFARHVMRLSLGRLASKLPAFKRGAGFGAIGVSGPVVAMWFQGYRNFALTDTLVYRGAGSRPGWQRYLLFLLINNVVLLARIPLLALFVTLGMNYLLANLLTLLLSFLVRFGSSDRFVYQMEKK